MVPDAPSRAPGSRRPLIGRVEVLEPLKAGLADLKSGRGSLHILVGPSGSGKSAVALVLVDAARAEGFLVLEGRSVPRDIPQPFQALQEALRGARGALTSASAAQAGGLTATVKATTGELLPLLYVPMTEEPEGEASASPTDPSDELWTSFDKAWAGVDSDRVAFFDRLTSLLGELGARQPVVLVLDDLHNADEATIGFVSYLAPLLGGLPVMVLTLAVPRGSVGSPLQDVLDDLVRQERAQRHELPPLTEAETTEYVRWLQGGRDPDPATLTRIFTQSEGNPLFIEQLVRGEGEAGGLGPSGGRGGPLKALLRERWSALPETSQRVLAFGAVLGRSFDFATLQRATREDEETLAITLEATVKLGLLRELPGESYEFRDEELRQDVDRMMTETRRRVLHQRVGEALEATPAEGGDATNRVFDLARHYYLGRVEAKSVQFNRRAAELSRQAHAPGPAILHLERALDSLTRLRGASARERMDLLVLLGELLDAQGDLRAAEERLREALGVGGADPNLAASRALGLLALGRTVLHRGQPSVAASLAQEALDALRGQGASPRTLVPALRLLAQAREKTGERQASLSAITEALTLARGLEDPGELAEAAVDMAAVLGPVKSERARAEELLAQALPVLQQMDDLGAVAKAEGLWADLKFFDGDPGEGFRHMHLAVSAAERSGSKRRWARALMDLAYRHLKAHHPEAGQHALRQAWRMLAANEEVGASQRHEFLEGLLAREHEQLDLASLHLEQAVHLADESESVVEAGEARLELAEVELERDRPTEAVDLYHHLEGGELAELHPELAPRLEALRRRLESSGDSS